MLVAESETIPIQVESDIVLVRRHCREWTMRIGFGLVEQTKLITAASELARNALLHGGGGECLMERIEANGRNGLRLTFIDRGAGITDIDQALTDGWSTGSGMGFGLGGAKRLVNEFHIESQPQQGTRVIIAQWK